MLNLSFMHLGLKLHCLLWKQETLSPLMLREKFYNSMNKFEIHKDL